MNFKSTYHAELARKESFKKILEELSGNRRKVFEAILHFYPVTDKQIVELTGLPINVVTPRRKELTGYRWEFVAAQNKSTYVFYPEFEYVEFDKYVSKTEKVCMWKPTDRAVILQPELIF